MDVIILLSSYFIIVNLIGFALMGIDKAKARRRAWRIPEATLFLFALIGGSLGTTIGMHFFHHKTLHWYFLYGMPAILAIQVLIFLFLINSPIKFIIF